jgi:hypothetical protein
MENLLDNMPEPLLNQIKDLGKGLEKYLQGQVVIIYDPNKDKVAGLYVPHSGLFTPDYEYFMILDYIGLSDLKEQEIIFNNIVIPNLNLPKDTTMNPKREKDKRFSGFIESVFRSALQKGTTKKFIDL